MRINKIMGADGGGGESRSEKELEQLLEQVGGWDTYQVTPMLYLVSVMVLVLLLSPSNVICC